MARTAKLEPKQKQKAKKPHSKSEARRHAILKGEDLDNAVLKGMGITKHTSVGKPVEENAWIPPVARGKAPEVVDGTPNEVIPPPPSPADTEPRLYTLKLYQCSTLLQESSRQNFKKLGREIAAITLKSPEKSVAILKRDRSVLRFLFESAQLYTFVVKRFLSDTDFEWTTRIAFRGTLKSVAHQYRLHFVLDPIPHFDAVEDLLAKRKAIELQPSLMGEINDDRLKEVEDKMTKENQEWEDLQEECPDIILDLETQGSEYTERGWTVIKFKIPATAVDELNERRANMNRYKVMLRDIAQ